MGVNRRDISLVLRLRQEGQIPDRARIIELGAQQLSYDLLQARELMVEVGRNFGAKGEPPIPAPKREPVFDGIEVKLDPDAPYARDLWGWLGFDYAAIDIDGSPGSIPLDLNFDEVPQLERNLYDLVTNYGTTEHVANQMNAFKIAHDLTAPGGVMIHNLPSQGNFNHGLVNYPPKFFWMLARSNDYQWLYFNYVATDNKYLLPENLVAAVSPFEREAAEELKKTFVSNSAFVVALKKRNAAPYVPPIDVPSGARTSDKKLLERYPTIFRAAN